MASGFINMLSYWFFFAASVPMFSVFLCTTGAASGGWTAYPPINGMRIEAVNKGSMLGFDLWALAMTLFVVSSLLGGLNYVATVLNLRTKGMKFMIAFASYNMGIYVYRYSRCFFPCIISGCFFT